MKIEADLTGWLGLDYALEEYDVVAFRVPKDGEKYISYGGHIAKYVGGFVEPRPILDMKKPTNEQIKETVVKAFNDIGRDIIVTSIYEYADGNKGVTFLLKK